MASSIKERVESKLKEAQKSKTFKDIGRVANTKKELAAFRLINIDNLDELEQDKVVAFNMVKKEAVWIPIDLYKEKEKGTTPGAAFLKVKIREYLPAKPKDGEGYRKAYVTALTTLQNDLAPLLTIEEIKTLVDSYFKLDVYDYSKKFIGNVPDSITREDFIQKYKEKTYRFFSPSSAINEQFGAKFKNLIYRNSDAAKELWTKAISYDAVSEQEAQEKKAALIERREKFIAANLFNIEEYKKMNNSQLMDKMRTGWAMSSYSIKEYKANPELFRNFAVKYLENKIENGKKEIDTKIEAIKQKDADWSWAFEEKVSDSGDVTVSKPKPKPINTKTPLAYIKRTGGYKVNDTSADAIVNTIGFTAVNYGNYVDDAWSKQHTKHFIEAMVDFGEILNIDIKKLTQLGSLKIAFGAKGRPGHLATYFPQTKDINLTKGNGDGSLAHEYGHYIDNVLLEGSNKSTTSYFITETQKHYDTILNMLFKELMNFLIKGKDGVTPLVPFTFYAIKSDRVPSVYISGENSQLSGKIQIKDTLEETIALYYPLCKVEFEDWKHRIQVDVFGYILNHFGVEKYDIPLKLKTSYFYHKSAYNNFIYNYYSDQKKKYVLAADTRTNYWTKSVELFARAFETVILKKFVDKNRMSNYLVADISLEDIISQHNQAPYPTGKELEVIEEYIDKIIARIKTLYAIGDFIAPSDVREDEYIDLTPTGKEDSGMVVTGKGTKKVEFTEEGEEVKTVDIVEPKVQSNEEKMAFIEKRIAGLKISLRFAKDKDFIEKRIKGLEISVRALGNQQKPNNQESSIVWSNLLEFLQSKLFKQKTKKTDTVIKNVANEFSEQRNPFVNPKSEIISFEELKKKFYEDKINDFFKNNKDKENEKHVDFFISYFNLDSSDFKKYLNSENQINKFAKGGVTGTLLAPNGKPSNLTPEQYKLVRTHEFKAWFGDWENDPENASKVVDENGEPLVVYHGTDNDFFEFNPKNQYKNHQYNGWSFFTAYKERAEFLGTKVLSVFLNIKNPKENVNVRAFAVKNNPIKSEFDGAIQIDPIPTFIVGNSNQIKLADGTNTTFDPENPDIRFRNGGDIPTGFDMELEAKAIQLRTGMPIDISSLRKEGHKYVFKYKGQSRESDLSVKLVQDIISMNRKSLEGRKLFGEGGGVDAESKFTFLSNSPMQRARALGVLEKGLSVDGKYFGTTYQWIESLPAGLETGTTEVSSRKTESGVATKLSIGDWIVNYKAEQDYYNYLQNGGYPYSKFVKEEEEKAKLEKEKQAVLNAEKAEKDKLRIKQEEENRIKLLHSIYKIALEDGQEAYMNKMLSRYDKEIEYFKSQKQTKEVRENLEYYIKQKEQATPSYLKEYKTIIRLYKVVDGNVVKKYNWKVGDKVLVEIRVFVNGEWTDGLVETEILEVIERESGSISYKVEKKEGINNPYLSYMSILPTPETEKSDNSSKADFIQKRIKALEISLRFSKDKEMVEKRIKALGISLKSLTKSEFSINPMGGYDIIYGKVGTQLGNMFKLGIIKENTIYLFDLHGKTISSGVKKYTNTTIGNFKSFSKFTKQDYKNIETIVNSKQKGVWQDRSTDIKYVAENPDKIILEIEKQIKNIKDSYLKYEESKKNKLTVKKGDVLVSSVDETDSTKVSLIQSNGQVYGINKYGSEIYLGINGEITGYLRSRLIFSQGGDIPNSLEIKEVNKQIKEKELELESVNKEIDNLKLEISKREEFKNLNGISLKVRLSNAFSDEYEKSNLRAKRNKLSNDLTHLKRLKEKIQLAKKGFIGMVIKGDDYLDKMKEFGFKTDNIKKVISINNKNDKHLPYRDIVKTVDKDDYFIATEVTFKSLNKGYEEWERLKSIPGAEFHRSPKSDSQYVIIGDLVYRYSDHWGMVASCDWDLEGDNGDYIYSIGVANIKDFKPKSYSYGYVIDNPVFTTKEYKKIKSAAIKELKAFLDSPKIQFNNASKLLAESSIMNKINKRNY